MTLGTPLNNNKNIPHMDPLTQGAAGALAAQTVSPHKKARLAAVVGFVAGGAADLDVFIQSEANPLLGLTLHRHFTHSFVFIPLGAFFVALGFWGLARWLKKPLSFGQLYLFSLLGFATHGLLDAATAYGTVLGWPFTNARFAWDWIAIIDPLLTLPILALIAAACWRRNVNYARAGLIYALFYFTVLAGHHYATRQVYLTDIPPTAQQTARVMPALFRPFSYRGIYRHEGFIYISTLKAPLLGDVKVHHHGRVRLVTPTDVQALPDFDNHLSKQFRKYQWFADGFVGHYSEHPFIIADYRYGDFGNPLSPLWGITLDAHGHTFRPVSLRGKHLRPEESD